MLYHLTNPDPQFVRGLVVGVFAGVIGLSATFLIIAIITR